MNVNCTPSTRNEKKTTTGVMKMISQLLLAFVFLTIGNVAFGQNYTGLDGGFEGSATIDNTNVQTAAQAGKWTKNNAATTIADETSVVRSGAHALSITNSTTTGRRVWSPLTTQTSTTGQTTITFWRRVTSIATNFQQSMAGVGNGTTTDASSGTYAVPSAINTWEKVTYTRTSWTYTDIAGVIFTRLQGSGTFYVYIDDLVVYPGAADAAAPSAATVPVIGTPTSSSLPVSWTGASGGVDGGGYLVVRHTADPTTAPNANGIYAVGNTIGSGTVVYQGTGTSFTDVSLSPGTTYYYRIYTYDKAYNYSGALTTNGTTSGGGSSTPPTLTAAGGATVDAPFNVTFTDDATWRAAITSITVGGTTLTAGYTVSSGQITFTPSASNPAGLLQTAGANKSIVITATGYTNATVSQTIGAGAANKLAISTQPTAPASNGAALAQQPVVAIQDQYGNATTSTATVTANVGAGSWTIGGTTGVAGVSGTVTFAGLTATSLGAVTGATISFTSPGLTGVTSGTFNIPAPPPPTLTAAVGATVDAPFDVTFTDNATWRAAITSITVGGTTISASAYSVTSGKITFTPSLSTLLQTSGSKNIIVIATGYSNTTTLAQSIGAGAPNKLAMSVQPAAPSVNGGALGTQPVVFIRDQYGNATTSTATVVANVGAGTWTVGGTTSKAGVSGTATFTNLTATSAAAVTGATITFTSTGLTSITSSTFNIPGPPPANDLCSGAVVLTAGGGTVAGSLSGATNSNSFGYAATKTDVWYKFTPTCTQDYTVTLTFASGPDIDFDAFAADCPTSGTAATAFQAHGTTTTETITTTFNAGTTYSIRVIDYNGDAGSFNISIVAASSPLTLSNGGTPVAGLIAQNSTNVTLFGFTLTPTCLSSYNFTDVAIATSGTATTSDINSIRLYYDVNGDGLYDVSDVLVGASTSLSNPIIYLSLTGQTGITSARKYILVANVASGATPGRTFTASLANADVVSNVTVGGTAPGNTMTIQGVPPTLTAAGSATVDAPFSITFTDNATWRSAITSITVGGTTLTAGYTVSAGQITFTPSASVPTTLLQTAGTKPIVVIATGYSNTSVSQTIGVGVASKLGMWVQPGNVTSNGSGPSTSPVIRVYDQYNNLITSATPNITATVGAGTWTIGGTTSVTASGGEAQFLALTATSAAAVSGATITFSASGLTSVTSSTFTIAAPDFLTIPALNSAVTENFDGMGANTGAVIPVGFSIQTGNTSTVTSSVGSQASSGAPSAGDSYNWGQSASERSLGFMYSGSYSGRSVVVKLKNSTGSTINSFDISFTYEQYRRNTATQTFKLQYSTSLTGTWTDVTGGDFTNIVSGTSTYSYSPLVASQSITITAFTPSSSIPDGSIVYFRWILDGSSSSSGVGVDNFSITGKTAAPPPTLNAASGATVDNPFTVTFTDDATWRGGISSILVGASTLSPSAYTVSAGQIVFTPSASTLLQSSGSKTITINSNGYNSAIVTQALGYGAATKLGITTQPTAPSVNGTALAAQPVLAIQDQYGNTVGNSTASVTATANTTAGTWTLGGTTTVSAVNGVVTFSGLTATSPAAVTGALIDFTSTGLTAIASNTFNIPQPDFLNMTAVATPVTQNFDGMGTSSTALISQGFKASTKRTADGTPAWVDATYNIASTTQSAGTSGTNAVSSGSSGGTYNFANGITASSTERALGFLTSGSYPTGTAATNIGLSILSRVKNNTGQTLSSVSLSFDYEKYRNGTNACNMTFFYSTDGSTWTAATAGNHSYVADGDNNIASGAPITSSKSVTITGLSIANGSDIYFRWSYSSGGSSAQAIGVDNFSITGCRTLSASVASTNTPICNGSNAVFNLTGTANATVTYNINGASNQTVTLNGSGNGTVTITGATVDQALNFVSIAEGGCSQSISGTTTVYINTVNTWVGLGDGSSWTDAANWSCGTPDGSTNLSISSGDVVLNTNYTIPSGKSLTLSGTATLTINATNTLTITGTADFGGRPVTLKSTSGSNAGAIGVIGNSGANLTNATAVTVERYIPASRKWRGITSPLSAATPGNSIYNSWQSNGTEVPGEGILLWNATGTGGFSLNSAPSASANIRGYTGGTGFTIPTTTTGTNIISGGKPVPYLVFITDNYRFGANTGNMTTGATATTIKATGTLYKGNYATGTLSSGYHMLPNPYPSPITLSSAVLSSVNDKFWVWDPKLSGFNGYGGYVATTNGVSAPVGVGGSYSTDSRVIPSGGAFWVQSTGSASITLTETLKGGTTFNIYGRQNNGTTEMIRVNLMNSNGDLYDGIAVAYQNDGNAAIDDKDAAKFAMLSENISVKRAGVDLAIEFRPLVDSSDTIFLNLYQLQKKGYVLNISGQGFDVAANLTAVLQDLYLNKETVLNIYGSQTYSFTVDNNAASSGERFRIVFRPSAVTPVTDLVSLKTIKLYPNPVSKGTEVQLQFRNSSAGKYEVTLYNLVGVQVMKQTITHGGGNGVQKLDLPQAMAAGTYIAEITDAKGNKGKVKLVIE